MHNKTLLTSGILMGVGMGGFIDGILLHQILQLHSMLSAVLPQETVINIKTSMIWDGFFHLLTWITTTIAVVLLWKAGRLGSIRWSGPNYLGANLFGWGLFNLLEGVIDHHLLGIHHVVEQLGLSLYDYLFLASGVVFMVAGWTLMRTYNPSSTA